MYASSDDDAVSLRLLLRARLLQTILLPMINASFQRCDLIDTANERVSRVEISSRFDVSIRAIGET